MIATAITSSAILAECQPVAGQWCQRSSHPEMPATDLNPGSPRSAREEISLNIIEEAISIFERMKSLTGEVTEHQMSLQCSNIHAFGIAQALHCSIQAGNLSPDLDVREVLEEVYRIDCASRARTGINRYRTLKALMKMGLIDPNAHPKTLRPLNSVPRPEVVLAYIALKRNTAVSLIVDRGRAKPVLAARFEAIWAMRTICGMSLERVGEAVGGRDHTTALNAINRCIHLCETKKEDLDAREEICEALDTLGLVQLRHEARRALSLSSK